MPEQMPDRKWSGLIVGLFSLFVFLVALVMLINGCGAKAEPWLPEQPDAFTGPWDGGTFCQWGPYWVECDAGVLQ